MRPISNRVVRCAVIALLSLGFVGVAIPSVAQADDVGITRSALSADSGFYPRMVRLAHNGAANGTIVASVNTAEQTGEILVSNDGGKSFQQRATITDGVAAPAVGSASEGARQLCCSTLLELPVAVGAMPEGTLLWADTVFRDRISVQRHVEQRLWASSDLGDTWRFVSTIQSADTTFNITPWGPSLPAAWEPNLSVSADGQLVAMYSDETDALLHSQKLVQVRSRDGVTWADKADTVVSADPTLRPGMGVAIKLPNGSYFMTYEVCSATHIYPCNAYFRTSADGWNYGDPRNLGTLIRTADGATVQHTPYPAWSPGPGPNGTILLSGQMIADGSGRTSPDTGHVMLANDNLGAGAWYRIPTPIVVNGVTDAPCKNYSSPLLPAADGKSVLQAATDEDGGACRAYVASGPLTVLPAPASAPPGLSS